MSLSDLTLFSKISNDSKKYIELFLIEPIAYKQKAEPGWRSVVFCPQKDSSELLIDIIQVKEWAFFTSLRLGNSLKSDFGALKMQQEVTNPIIPEDYVGSLSKHFDEIKEEFPNWNRVPLPSLIIGCISPHDTRNEEQLHAFAKESYAKMIKYIDNMQSLTNNIDLGSVFPSGTVDRDKLN